MVKFLSSFCYAVIYPSTSTFDVFRISHVHLVWKINSVSQTEEKIAFVKIVKRENVNFLSGQSTSNLKEKVQKVFSFPPWKKTNITCHHLNSLSQHVMICFHLIEYFQTAEEIKTCISNIRISLNFWESLKRNSPFVKYQQLPLPLPYFPSNFPCTTWFSELR